MAESAVWFLLDRLQTLLENEARQLTGVRGEVEQVRDELEAMKAFLREADAMEDTDEGLGVWVKQVRELAYDAEDVIDHFLIRFEHPKPSGLFGRLSKISRVLKTLKARRRVAFELQEIKSRAVDISERRKRYDYNWSSTHGSSSSAQNLSTLRDNARLVPEARLVGIESQKSELLGWVLEDAEGSHGVRVKAVQGMGGLGKTTLVSQVFKDDQVKQHFQLRVWITVSQTFDEREALLEIIKQIGSPILEEACFSTNIHSLKADIQSFLREKRYLVVLDDIWTLNAWDSLKYAFLENNFSSCLIITTRIIDVATKVTRDIFGGNIHALAPLSEENSWHLFCSRVFHGEQCPDHILEDSRLILERCKGLPLAIVSVSGLLASKHTSKEEWLRVRRNLEGELFGNDQLSDMGKILSLSFNDLPYHLKSCVLYLSMFPEDILYNKGYIAKLWIAEGFVKQMGSATPEEVADLYFLDLFNRSLIQMVEKGFRGEDYSKFNVHDLVREVLLRKSRNQNFAATFDEQNLVVPKGVRRLSIGTTFEKLQRDHDFSRLRSLIFIPSKGSIISSTSMSEFLSNCGLRLLKVLACSYLALDTFPKFIITQYGLRYLDMSHTKVKSIPSSIGRLRHLETLILSDTLVEELPDEILKVHGLRHLIAYCTDSEGSSIGVRVPTGIHTLTSLQTLSVIKVSECGLDFVKSLGKLKQLQDLHVHDLREEHGPVLCSSIEQMSHLRELRMKTTDDNEILDLQHISSPPPNLERLHVNGSMTTVPSCISDKLKSLALLSFKNCKLKDDPLESLRGLPNLLLLEFLENSYDGDSLCFRVGGFKMLKKLGCISLGKLRGVTLEEGSLPSLESIYFRNCKLLEKVPPGFEFLSNLKKLYFIDMGDQFVTRLRSKNEDSDFHRIKHVQNWVAGSYDAEGNWKPIEFED